MDYILDIFTVNRIKRAIAAKKVVRFKHTIPATYASSSILINTWMFVFTSEQAMVAGRAWFNILDVQYMENANDIQLHSLLLSTHQAKDLKEIF